MVTKIINSPKYGEFKVKIDKEFSEVYNKYKWAVVKKGRKTIRFYVKSYAKGMEIYLHRLVLNCPRSKVIDHINGDTLDNRANNLRICTIQQNVMGQAKQSNKSSKFKGVTWDKNRKKWYAQIKSKLLPYPHKKHLGRFENELDAANAYDVAAKLLFKQYARTNK